MIPEDSTVVFLWVLAKKYPQNLLKFLKCVEKVSNLVEATLASANSNVESYLAFYLLTSLSSLGWLDCVQKIICCIF